MEIGVAVRERIRELCREHGLTVNMLATRAGITQSTLNNRVSGRNHSTTLSTVQKICDGLEIPSSLFFKSALFDEIEQEVK